MSIVEQSTPARASGNPEVETLLAEWRDAKDAGENPPWPLPLPGWAIGVKVHQASFDDDDYMVFVHGRDWTAGSFAARIERIYIVYGATERAKCGEEGVVYHSPESAAVVVPELSPDQTWQEAEQIAYVIGSAAAELRVFEEASVA
ncbi:hypothetical protein [Agromyces sp. NPDC055658]